MVQCGTGVSKGDQNSVSIVWIGGLLDEAELTAIAQTPSDELRWSTMVFRAFDRHNDTVSLHAYDCSGPRSTAIDRGVWRFERCSDYERRNKPDLGFCRTLQLGKV